MMRDSQPNLLRRALLMGGAATLCVPRVVLGQAKETVRIGVPTKTYFPTIIAETAIRHKLFEKEGINAELTIYRGGAEGFEAIAAGAADLIFNSSSSVAGGLKKGVNVRCVANGGLGYYGWYLMVKPDSKITKVSELEGKKVGITSAGSGSDILARWTLAERKVNFTRVPLGGGGLVPNLMSGNIDATVLYSPLSFQLMHDKEGRAIIDFGAEVPPHSTGSWIATDKIIKERPQALQKDAQRPLRRRSRSCAPTPIGRLPSSWSPRSTKSRRRSRKPSWTATSRNSRRTANSRSNGSSVRSRWRS